MGRILVTGANGFVGNSLCHQLTELGVDIIATVRTESPDMLSENNQVEVIGTIHKSTYWKGVLEGVDTVIHLAARVHVMDELSVDPLFEFRSVNTFGTLNLAKQAAQAGVKRFIFISTIKVNGEQTSMGLPFKPDDTNTPIDPYGLSKYEAEVGLRKIARETGMEVVIIRPSLVYGPGVKGNFVSMMKWLAKGLPLPLGAIHNKRSLVSLDNLVDLITICIDHPNAANETFLVSDGNDISTTMLLTKLATLLNVPRRLLPIPSAWLMFFAKLLGRKNVAQRLLGSLHVDISKTKTLLGWTPPYTVDESLKKTAQFFITHEHKAKQ